MSNATQKLTCILQWNHFLFKQNTLAYSQTSNQNHHYVCRRGLTGANPSLKLECFTDEKNNQSYQNTLAYTGKETLLGVMFIGDTSSKCKYLLKASTIDTEKYYFT